MEAHCERIKWLEMFVASAILHEQFHYMPHATSDCPAIWIHFILIYWRKGKTKKKTRDRFGGESISTGYTYYLHALHEALVKLIFSRIMAKKAYKPISVYVLTVRAIDMPFCRYCSWMCDDRHSLWVQRQSTIWEIDLDHPGNDLHVFFTDPRANILHSHQTQNMIEVNVNEWNEWVGKWLSKRNGSIAKLS